MAIIIDRSNSDNYTYGYKAMSGETDEIVNKYLGTSYILTHKADFEPGRSSDFILKIKFTRDLYDMEGNNVYNTGKHSELQFEQVGVKQFVIALDTTIPKSEVSPFNKYMLRDIDGTLLYDKPIYCMGMCYGYMNDRNNSILHGKPTITYFKVAFADENDNRKYIQYALLANKTVVNCGTYDN